MNAEELLKPRYKVIARWPQMREHLEVGEILKGERGYLTMESKELFADYPHLLKRLEWWEEREKKDLPECVILDGITYNVEAYSSFKGGTFYTKSKNGISRPSYPLENSIPVDSTDQIKKKIMTIESKAKLAEIHAANFYDNWCEYTERDGEYLKRSSVIELLQEYGASVSVTLCGYCGYAHPYHEETCIEKVKIKEARP
jgi:hypothetical protein